MDDGFLVRAFKQSYTPLSGTFTVSAVSRDFAIRSSNAILRIFLFAFLSVVLSAYLISALDVKFSFEPVSYTRKITLPELTMRFFIQHDINYCQLIKIQ